ncbi:uncharacterized protein LOC143283995 [Babylonia areolata]|uniref:uncharacterized protein LOC143283995 n=1 Tax=Babylonia areolata TaxID=304850 RepID=UPI003FD39FBA
MDPNNQCHSLVEEQFSITSNNESGPGATTDACLDDVQASLVRKLRDVKTAVTLIRQVLDPEDFHWTSQSACELLNSSSCSGLVVSLSSDARTESFKKWAAQYVLPYVIVPQNRHAVTSLDGGKMMTPSRGEHLLLQQLLSHLEWSQVAVLVDTRSTDSSATAEVVQQLSEVYMGTVVFRLFDHPPHDQQEGQKEEEVGNRSSGQVRESLQLIKESRFRTMLVLASAPSADLILREAMKMRLLSREHYWVIALPFNYCLDLVKEVKAMDANILTVRPLLDEEVEDLTLCPQLACACETPGSSTVQASPSGTADALEALIRSTELVSFLESGPDNIGVSSSTCGNSTETRHRRSVIVKGLEQYQRAKKQKSTSTKYSICSTEAGREEELVKVGWWSEDSGLQLTQDQLFRNTFRDFGYRTIKVGTQEAKPFVQKIGNTSMFEGFCVDILNELATALKFQYEFVEPLDGEWGAPKDDGSGNWTGIVRQVLDKEVDFGIGPFTITSIREDVIDFTKPFMEDGVGILTKRPNSEAHNMFKMFTPLTPQVWAAVAGSVLLVSAALCAMERVSPFSARNLDGDRRLGMLGSVWLIYGSYMEQGGDPHPRSVSARFLVGFWWLFTILMTSTYTANLAAFLTVTIEEIPINSLTELAAHSDMRPLVKTGSNVMTLFQEAEGGVYQQIWSRMVGMPVVKSNREAMELVQTGDFAYMTDASQLEYIMLKDCHTFSVAKELFNTGGFGFVLQEESPYMDAINYNIMKMQEAGLMDKWRHRWWSSPDTCSSTDRTSTAKELDWVSLSGLFYIFLGVTATAILCRVLEVLLRSEKTLKLWNRFKSLLHRAASSNSDNGDLGRPCRCCASGKADGKFCHGCSSMMKRGTQNKSPSSRVPEHYAEFSSSSSFPSSSSSAARFAFEGPYVEDEEEKRSVKAGHSICLRRSRSPEFQDFDCENQYWEPPLHGR